MEESRTGFRNIDLRIDCPRNSVARALHQSTRGHGFDSHQGQDNFSLSPVWLPLGMLTNMYFQNVITNWQTRDAFLSDFLNRKQSKPFGIRARIK